MMAPKRREFQLETSGLQHSVNPGSWSRDSQPEVRRAKKRPVDQLEVVEVTPHPSCTNRLASPVMMSSFNRPAEVVS